MSQIRKQSIISSMVVYIGFALGFFNIYLFTRSGSLFSAGEYGLTQIFIAIANVLFSFANLGMTAYIGKFYPYYTDNLPKKQNDMFTWAMLISLIGFCGVALTGYFLKDLMIRKFGENSPLLVTYYYWLYPFGLGLTLYSILELYAWQLKEAVFTTFLREILFRVFTTILILLFFVHFIANFDIFIKIYSFTYIGIAATLAVYLAVKGDLHITFTRSIVTKKFFKKIVTLVSYVFGGVLLFSISSVFDSILLASVLKNGLIAVAVFAVAQNIASILQAPQRGIIASATAALAQAWKDKDMAKINRIYHRSSINQLIFAVGVFALIWLNFSDDSIHTLHIKSVFIDAKWVFFFIGLTRIIDMGTGLNAQILGTSNLWRFEFFTGVVLIVLTLPLNYILTKYYFGVTGPAIANLFSFTVYNALRYWFLKKKFNLQPFTIKTLYTLLMGAVLYCICYFLFRNFIGFIWIMLRSIAFIALYISATLFLELSPDIIPVWHTLLKRLKLRKEPELI